MSVMPGELKIGMRNILFIGYRSHENKIHASLLQL